MTDTMRPLFPVDTQAPDQRDLAPPVSGLLTAESEHTVSVRVGEGTWTFDRADVLRLDAASTDDRPGRCAPPGTEATQRQVRVWVRPGTTADFTQRRSVDLVERPMTLAHGHSPALGDELLSCLTEDWARELQLPAGAGGIDAATFTFCQTRTYARDDDGTARHSLD